MEERLTIVLDVDGTLCPVKRPEQDYAELEPDAEMVARLRNLRAEAGAYIILQTSRNMRTYAGNVGKINANTAPVLLAWLKEWDIPFDEIYFGKPWAGRRGFYVDDRAVRPGEFLRYTEAELEKLCGQDRTEAGA